MGDDAKLEFIFL